LPYDIDDLDNAFGAFNVLPGGTLVSQTIGKYPFANQYVAANATIREPLTVSVIMDTPMRKPNAWEIKNTVMTALKATLDAHNVQGGTYTVVTPSYVYQNMILTSLTDNSRGNNSIPQNAWRFDFERPLVALAELAGVQNLLMQKLTNKVFSDGTVTGTQVGTLVGNIATGANPQTMGAISGGNAFPSLGAPTSTFMNFPAATPISGFPFTGMS
jgi:hypothetical protein